MMQKLGENSIFNTYFKELSIQINLDGLSFCIFNPVEKRVESIYNFSIDFTKSKTDIEKQIYAVLQSEEDLRQDFNTIKVLHNTPAFTLVPKALFSEKKDAVHYLKYSIDTTSLPPDYIEIDKIIPMGIINIYVPDVFVNGILLDYYGMFDYQHFASSLLRTLLKHYASHSHDTMYLYAEQNLFYLVVFRDKNLYYFNRFDYESIEDFLYFILYTTVQLNVDTDRIPLYVTGDLNVHSLIFKMMRKYIKYVYFIKLDKEHFSDGMNEELIRKSFILTQSF